MFNFRPMIVTPVPDGWYVKESVTVLAPDGQANVIHSSEDLDASIDTALYADLQGQLLMEEFPGYEEHSFVWIRLTDGRRAVVREFSWTPPDGVSVTQIQLYYAENARGFTATATTPTSQFPRFSRQLRDLLMNVSVARS